MDFISKRFKIEKTRNYIKLNNMFVFLNGANRKTGDWTVVEQELKKIDFNYHKILNKASRKTLTNSILLNTYSLINSITFLLKPFTNKEVNKNLLFNKIEALNFLLLAIKINNKVYSKPQIKKLLTLNYENNAVILHNFLISNTKIIFEMQLFYRNNVI
jgi:hypothetical protein